MKDTKRITQRIALKRKYVAPIIRRLVAATMTSLIVSAIAFGRAPQQQSGSSKDASTKGRAPVNKEDLKFKLPPAYETILKNGLQVVVVEQHRLPTFVMQMVVLGGELSDAPYGRGTAQFTASLLPEGTKTRTSKQIAEENDSLGTAITVNSGLITYTTITSLGLIENLDRVMALFADLILNPSFSEDELSKLKKRYLAQLRAQRAQPRLLALEMFQKALYGLHPASRTSLSEEELRRITPEMLRAFHSVYYRPNNAIFVITGDARPVEIVAMLEKHFASWRRAEVPQSAIPKVGDSGPAKIYLIDRPSSVQTTLVLGNLTVERSDPDYYALEVMNQVIGGGLGGRLYHNLREEKGYAYSASSSFSALRYRGTFQVRTEVRTEVTTGSMNELMYELKRIRDERVPGDELHRAKRTLIGWFATQLESPLMLLSRLITEKLYGLPHGYWDAYAGKISAVTGEDVQRVARKYLDPGHLQVIAVGDAGEIGDVLKRYGAVEIYDTEGKPVKAAIGKK